MKSRHIVKIILIMIIGIVFCQTAIAASPIPQIRVYDQKKLTYKILSNRMEKGEIIIERCKGKVVNKRLDGKIINPAQKGYDYISYRSVEGARKGDKIVTYFVYNPYTNAEDDIILRLDFIL